MVPTILVLDRNSTVQRVMKLALKEENVKVNTIQRGEDALASIDAQPPDIIFTDDARKVVAFLKSRPKLSHIPVVLMKGAFDASIGAADEELSDDVLMKPLQPDAVIDCVKRLLRPPTAAAPNVQLVPPGAERADGDLDLERYFDRLDAAFNEADSTPFGLDAETWDSGFPSVAEVGHRAPIARAGLDHHVQPVHAVSSELVDQITQRVLDKLGERIVRSTATEVVSRLSKWLLVNEVGRSRNTQ
jgi:CheY-like chemotaxis protein